MKGAAARRNETKRQGMSGPDLPKGVTLDLMEPEPIEAPAPLVVHHLPGRGQRLVVAFAGVGRHRGRVPPPEFIGTSSAKGENHVLFVSDPTRSWMNGAGMADTLVRLIEDYMAAHGLTDLVALGNSMGGFAAITLADLAPVDRVIAFSPQVSMHPDVVDETRWRTWREKISDWPFRDVGSMAAEGTEYYVFHGDHPMEAMHWLRFPKAKHVHHFILEGGNHDIAALLRKRVVLGRVIEEALENRPRMVRVNLERTFGGRFYRALRRAAYEAEFPDLRIGEDGRVTGHPRQREKSE